MPVPRKQMTAAKLNLLLAAALLLAGCAPLPTPSAVPSPQPLRIQADAVFEPLYGLMASCVPGGSTLYYTASTEPSDARLGWAELPEADSHSFALGEQKLVLVVNPRNSLTTLSTDQLHDIYTGVVDDWQLTSQAQTASPINAWGYPPEDFLGDIFRQAFSVGNARAANIQTAPGPAQMRAAVAKDPQAIGFLPEWWLDSSVKALSINSTEQGNLSLPILAGTKSEPQGALRAWLVCLQEGLKAR